MIKLNENIDGSLIGFTREDGQYINLSRDFIPEIPGLKRNSSAGRRQGGDGCIELGDGYYNERMVTIRAKHHAEDASLMFSDPAKYAEGLDLIEWYFARDQGPFYLIDHQMNQRARVFPLQVPLKERPGLRRVIGDLSMTFVMQESLWEDRAITIFPGNGSGESGASGSGSGIALRDGQTYIFTNECLQNVFPVFYFTALDNVTRFSLENTTLDGGFEFADNDFRTGAVLEMSSVDDSRLAIINDVNKSASIIQGGPIWFTPGNNTLLYRSDYGDLDLILYYRQRYAH